MADVHTDPPEPTSVDTTPFLLRILKENSRARRQLGWIIGSSAACGAVMACAGIFAFEELRRTELFAFMQLPFSEPGSFAGSFANVLYAILERMPALPIGIALACIAALLAAGRYFSRYRHTFRKINLNIFHHES